jgi:hypothetical protein
MTCGLIPEFRDLAATTEMLKPYDAEQMRRYPVSTRVNNVANDDRECSEPIEVPGNDAGRTFLMRSSDAPGSKGSDRWSQTYALRFLSAHRAFINADNFLRIARLIGLRPEAFF